MGMLFSVFWKKLFGPKSGRLKKTLSVYLLVFWSLHIAGFQIKIPPFILYLTVSTFTAGVMWQALSSEDNAAYMQNMFMLPFERRKFIFSYVSALGAYTFFTKTAGLLAVMLAVSSQGGTWIAAGILCIINAILMTACVYFRRKNMGIGIIWAGVVIAAIFWLWNCVLFFPIITGNILLEIYLLSAADAYSFYRADSRGKRSLRSGGSFLVWRYLYRNLTAHKNYLVNTVVMWGAACVLPSFLGKMDSLAAMPVGFAILSLNTPVCILLSCDPALERAVRFLPGQKRAFCLPYCLFIFLCNMSADTLFLCSWQIHSGSVGGIMILTAAFFAMQSAIGSVLLEWFWPIRGWKIENDLWHHPRKYIVPIAMLLAAGAITVMIYG